MQIETLISLIPGTQTRCGNWAEVGWNLYEEPQWDQKMALGGHLNAWDVSPSQGQLHNWVPVKRPVEAGPGTPRPPRTFISPAKYRKIISHQWAQCSSPRFKFGNDTKLNMGYIFSKSRRLCPYFAIWFCWFWQCREKEKRKIFWYCFSLPKKDTLYIEKERNNVSEGKERYGKEQRQWICPGLTKKSPL